MMSQLLKGNQFNMMDGIDDIPFTAKQLHREMKARAVLNQAAVLGSWGSFQLDMETLKSNIMTGMTNQLDHAGCSQTPCQLNRDLLTYFLKNELQQ